MNKEEAIAYCYKHANEYKRDVYAAGGNGEREFDCLISILEEDVITPEQLKDYGMNY